MNIFIITRGEYEDYSIHSVWSSKEVADGNCGKLNAGEWYSDYRVEEYPLDAPIGDSFTVAGFKASYNFSEHGLDVNVSDVVFAEAFFRKVLGNRVREVGSEMLEVLSERREKCLRVLSDGVAQKKAEREGII